MTNPDRDELPGIQVDEAMLEASSGAILVDVREQDEWDAGHAPTATFVPLSSLQDRVAELPRNERLLIVCHSGMRSLRATSFLRDRGLDAVNVEGGMAAWIAAGGPVTVDSHSANSVKD